jgi:hypothetical protein
MKCQKLANIAFCPFGRKKPFHFNLLKQAEHLAFCGTSYPCTQGVKKYIHDTLHPRNKMICQGANNQESSYKKIKERNYKNSNTNMNVIQKHKYKT